jgi:hypothetical protein
MFLNFYLIKRSNFRLNLKTSALNIRIKSFNKVLLVKFKLLFKL